MNLYPAIDILGGSAVRLVKGDFDAKKVYDEDPLAAASAWVQAGARFLHVVDLDGAKGGEPVNLEHLRRIAALGVPVQYGGGLRTVAALEEAFEAGAARAILGTAAFTGAGLLERALDSYGADRVVVSVDVREGEVSIEGWTKAAAISVREVFAGLIDEGVTEFAYTNVDRDGMLGGLNFEDLIWVAKAAEHGHLIYSGGIGDIDDLRHLAKLRREARLESLTGVIVGKALYEGRFTIAEAHEALAG
ncbi:MAG TPA: 1-(5-phosphoribosyl)-5-[(5-phosphoribosylamino)methylideneamino]imidazole-4-carboxamide isomerase [Solirubrobacteraceae bacterium]|nr:1-(5-phosphoribosyl)-5-[(5-phosphoribosylamino)methylideneamino]imidazole-4-carboxamide isomerase [Solirubrobacteraceae bacterium]